MSLPPIYVPIGHGEEDITGEKPVMPPGCQLVVLAECKRPVTWFSEGNTEQTNIKAFIESNPEYTHIFADPVNNRRAINTAIGSVCAFYTYGDEYPDIIYDLYLMWSGSALRPNIRYSGIVPFTTFISNEEETGFTTKDVFKKIYPGGLRDYNVSSKPEEIYKYSEYPRPQEFPRESSTEDEMIEFLIHCAINSSTPPPTRESLEGTAKAELYDMVRQNIGGYDKIQNVRLTTLMKQMPGVYYHFICRGDIPASFSPSEESSVLLQRRRKSFIKHRLPQITGMDLIQYMRNPRNVSGLEIIPLLSENVRPLLGHHEDLPENIRNQLNRSRPYLYDKSGEGGRRRTYKQRRRKRKTRKTRR
jgi:hypothetical protein